MMKKTLSKLFVGLMAFCIGVFAVNYYLLSSKFYAARNSVQVSRQNSHYQKRSKSVSDNGVIGVYFNGFVQTKDGMQASFNVVNHSNKTAYYYSYPAVYTDQKTYTEPDFRADGVDKPNTYFCGDGLETFKLKSGDSLTIYVWGSYLNYYFESEKENQVGFNFSIGKKGNYKTYWSENIYFPAEIKSQVRNELKQRQEEENKRMATPAPKFLY